MRKYFIAATGLVLAACSNTPPKPEIVFEPDPRIEALENVSISLEDELPPLDLTPYKNMNFRVVEIDEMRYIAMSISEYERVLITIKELYEYIDLQRGVLEEQNRLVEEAISSDVVSGEEVGGADRSESR